MPTTTSALASELAHGAVDPDAVVGWAETLSDAFLQCRDLRHSWRPYTARWDDEAREYVRVHRCSRCRTRRTQHLSVYGAVQSTGYTYPDGYLAPAGIGGISSNARDALRLTVTIRTLSEE